jgi:CDP-4-dehydro-6-deoxyglucose reductase, E3
MLQAIQQFLRWMFLRVESVFNRTFGDKLNPFYHLGTISFLQFWLVIGSGLYLYIFTETAVHGAFASVERITHDQWFAGGILRSVHRYATDGMILTMLLHLLRHFAYDRYRGFRWFSWVSGGMLLWLVYLAGINGFMLVWDQLAQFVVVASSEWLDVLPVFNGALIRNFITADNVNDRLFTLLAFMHLGIPLAVGLLLWIHVQRIPQARINPPRQIVIGICAMFFALALIQPVVSQGGEANLGVVPGPLAFDWIELGLLPLVYVFDPLVLWAFVIGASGLLFLAPWLPPRGRGAGLAEYQISVQPGDQVITARFDETLLDAGLRQEIGMPYECRNGGCGLCKCTVTKGRVDPGIYQADALTASELAAGKVLLCCATALEDVEISLETGIVAPPIREYEARVSSMEKLNYDVMRVTLRLNGGLQLAFAAGQYINVLLADRQCRAFSFANPPHQGKEIELQIRRVEGGLFTTHVFEQMKVGDPIRFEGPLGDFTLNESTRPIVFVAGATGFAPAKSMVEDAFHRGVRRPIYLYWGVRQLRDLYLPQLPLAWAREHDNFHFIPVLSEPAPEDHWQGRTGLVHEAILQDFPDLQGHEIYACGSVRMVEALFPSLKRQGAEDGMCFSDAFAMSARSMVLQPRP